MARPQAAQGKGLHARARPKRKRRVFLNRRHRECAAHSEPTSAGEATHTWGTCVARAPATTAAGHGNSDRVF